MDISETLYIAYPLATSDEGKNVIDAALVSERFGIIAFIFANSKEDISLLCAQQDELYYQLEGMLRKSPGLRKGRHLALDPIVVSLFPNSYRLTEELEDNLDYKFSAVDKVIELLKQVSESPDKNTFKAAMEAMQRISKIKPKKKRSNVSKNDSKELIIKKIESEIANLDSWQNRAALEFVDGPQRIRGLAGSGKTVVLALKAAYLHTQHPDWNIVVTYYTRSLNQQFRDLITKFCNEYSEDDPDWDHLHIFHSWGSPSEEGMYSSIAHSIGVVPLNFTNAKAKYGSTNPFDGICKELLTYLDSKTPQLYDMVLIDEAQDLPASFFQLVYSITKPPKKIVWAYDEIQTLNNSIMPSLTDMFGRDSEEKDNVVLKNEPDKPQADIVPPVCYRNPPWILALAHALGFGIYHNPLIQHFEDPSLWTEIGYEIIDGNLEKGHRASLKRADKTTPEYFDRLLSPEDAISFKVFDTPEKQYKWIADSILSDIEKDELDPDDILVVFPNALEAKSHYYELSSFLNAQGINSFLAGVTGSHNIIKQEDEVCCASIYRAKGNEAPMVYVVNSEYCFEGIELIKLRNTLFTAATRSRAWLRVCGVGDDMKGLIDEFEKIRSNNYRLDFIIPTDDEIAQIRRIHRDRTEYEVQQIDEAEASVKKLLDMMQNGDLSPHQVPGIRKLATYLIADDVVPFDE